MAPNVEGWSQLGELGLALGLASVIGFEREFRQKSAGLRTHTLVGLGAALFVLVSKYGFSDVLQKGAVVVDPSRVAAQIVSGIGFIGAGLIFVRRSSVHGLTTAAGIWLTAAVGAAAGAGLPVLASAGTGGYLFVSTGYRWATGALPRSSTAISTLKARYLDGRGLLRKILEVVSARGFSIDEVSTEPAGQTGGDGGGRLVEVTLHVHGRGSVNELAVMLKDIEGVEAVSAEDVNLSSE